MGKGDRYYVRINTEYGCIVYQVINKSTGVVAFYDKNPDLAQKFCDRLNGKKLS